MSCVESAHELATIAGSDIESVGILAGLWNIYRKESLEFGYTLFTAVLDHLENKGIAESLYYNTEHRCRTNAISERLELSNWKVPASPKIGPLNLC